MVAVLVHVDRQGRVACVVAPEGAMALDVAGELPYITTECRRLTGRATADRTSLDAHEAERQPRRPRVADHERQHRSVNVTIEIGFAVFGRLQVRRVHR